MTPGAQNTDAAPMNNIAAILSVEIEDSGWRALVAPPQALVTETIAQTVHYVCGIGADCDKMRALTRV